MKKGWLITLLLMLASVILPVSAVGARLVLTFDPSINSGNVAIALLDENLPAAQLEDPEVIARAASRTIVMDEKPIQNGKVVFENLQAGTYYVFQKQACDGYEPFEPFLVQITDSTDAEIDAQPKLSPIPQVPLPIEPEKPKPPTPSQPGQPDDNKPVPPTGPSTPSTPFQPSNPPAPVQPSPNTPSGSQNPSASTPLGTAAYFQDKAAWLGWLGLALIALGFGMHVIQEKRKS